jgi:hypothetical protein
MKGALRSIVFVALIATLMLLEACVMVERFAYIALEGPQVRIEATGLIQVENHLGSKGPIPIRYSVQSGKEVLSFERDPADYQGGILITVQGPDSPSPYLETVESPMAVPGYGDCRAYYQEFEHGSLYFFDLCPPSLERQYEVVFDLATTSHTKRIRIPYSIRRAGLWWANDSL